MSTRKVEGDLQPFNPKDKSWSKTVAQRDAFSAITNTAAPSDGADSVADGRIQNEMARRVQIAIAVTGGVANTTFELYERDRSSQFWKKNLNFGVAGTLTVAAGDKSISLVDGDILGSDRFFIRKLAVGAGVTALDCYVTCCHID